MPSIRKKLAGKSTKLAQPRENLPDHPAALNNYDHGSFYQIDINLIHPDPKQPRQYFNLEALTELCESIKQKGVLQPIIVRKDEENKIWLVAGERRFRAAKMANLPKIPAILSTGNPAEIALIENIQRENLKPVEEAEAFGRMIDEHQYTQEKLARAIGKARSTVTEALSLNKLPEEIKAECRRADTYPRRLLLEISKQKTPKRMIAIFKQAKKNNLKSDQLRDITRKPGKKRTVRTPGTIALDRTVSLADYLEKLELNNASESERIQLMTEMQRLKQIIDSLIA
jgi:ParB family chromosome partitioning protein